MENEAVVAEVVWRHVNAWPDRPAGIALDMLGKDVPAMGLSPGQGGEERRFVDGGCVGTWPFVVRVRADGGDTRGRLDAAGVLVALGNWLARAEPPALGEGRRVLSMGMAGEAALADAQEDGTAVYEAAYVMVYQVGGKAASLPSE